MRLLTSEPGTGIDLLRDRNETTTSINITRYKEFWGDKGDLNDVLQIAGQDVVTPTVAPQAKRVNALFAFDDDVDGVSDLSVPLPDLFALPFISGVDLVIPAANPPTGSVPVRMVVSRRRRRPGGRQRSQLAVGHRPRVRAVPFPSRRTRPGRCGADRPAGTLDPMATADPTHPTAPADPADPTDALGRRPVFLFDGDCAFCTYSRFIDRSIPTSAEVTPWQFADLGALGVVRRPPRRRSSGWRPTAPRAAGPDAHRPLTRRRRLGLAAAQSTPRFPAGELGRLARVPVGRPQPPPHAGGTAACSLPQAERDRHAGVTERRSVDWGLCVIIRTRFRPVARAGSRAVARPPQDRCRPRRGGRYALRAPRLPATPRSALVPPRRSCSGSSSYSSPWPSAPRWRIAAAADMGRADPAVGRGPSHRRARRPVPGRSRASGRPCP